MRKIYFFPLFLLTLILSTSKISANEIEFNKYSYPVLYPGPEVWDSKTIHTSSILYENNVYKMWYSGWDGEKSRIGYATSSNGIEWIKNKDFLINTLPEETEVTIPTILHDDGLYKIWLLSTPNQDIIYAESTDGINNWLRKSTTGLNERLDWENGSLAPGTVLKLDNIYYLWYTAVDNGSFSWKIGVATSSNSIDWKKFDHPISGDIVEWDYGHNNHPSVVYDNGKFHFWYANGLSGVNYAYAYSPYGPLIKPQEGNPVIDLNGSTSFDNVSINRPWVVKVNDTYHMWYSGFNGIIWSIGYASSKEIPNTSLKPVVIIPGMFASWDTKALLEGADEPQTNWKMNSFVKDYEGLINTLKNAGYVNDEANNHQNLFVFNYDWRKPLNETAEEFRNFLDNKVVPKNPDKKIYIVGHSLGGLIGRTYLQTYGKDKTEQLITVASPHSGTLQAYKAWSGGIIENDNILEKLAFEVLLGINNKSFLTTKDAVREIAPITHDLLPTFDYLVNEKNQVIKTSNLNYKNDFLNNLETNFPFVFNTLSAVYSETGKTSEFYKVQKPNMFEEMLGLWKDGKPIESLYSSLGDEVVLHKSATRSADTATLVLGQNHRNIIAKKDGITKLTNLLGVKTDEIVESQESNFSLPSLILLLQSPATLNVFGPSGNFKSGEENMIIIPNVVSGNYEIDVNGTEKGKYHLLIGQILNNVSFWKEIQDNTDTSEKDIYNIYINSQNPLPDPLTDYYGLLHLNNAIEKVSEIKDESPHWTLNLALKFLTDAKGFYEKKQYEKSNASTLKSLDYLFAFRKKQTIIHPLNSTYDIFGDLIAAYDKIGNNNNLKTNRIKIAGEIAAQKIVKEAMFLKVRISNNEIKLVIYQEAEQLLLEAEKNLNSGNLHKANIQLNIAKQLFTEI